MATTESTKDRVPRKGNRSGVVREYTYIGKVKPGHEKAMRDDLKAFLANPRRAGAEGLKKVGILAAMHTLFDNDTRLLGTIWFDQDFDPYFDDVFAMVGVDLYESFFRHADGFPEKGWTGGLSGQAGFEHAKNWLAKNHSDVISFVVTLPELTLKEQVKAQRLLKAFQKVLDHPDAEKALQHPALKPLLDEAAD